VFKNRNEEQLNLGIKKIGELNKKQIMRKIFEKWYHPSSAVVEIRPRDLIS